MYNAPVCDKTLVSKEGDHWCLEQQDKDKWAQKREKEEVETLTLTDINNDNNEINIEKTFVLEVPASIHLFSLFQVSTSSSSIWAKQKGQEI